MRHFLIAFFSLPFFAVLFEPMRLALFALGDEVGGVGGIGGLTNQFAPGTACVTKNIASRSRFYCFVPGFFAGLTPMAAVTLLCVVLPFLIASSVTIIQGLRSRTRKSMSGESSIEFASEGDEAPLRQDDDSSIQTEAADVQQFDGNTFRAANQASFVKTVKILWICISILWMLVPLCYFLTSKFYNSSIVGVVLAFSLSASLPLSWHLAMVATPSAGFMGQLMGLGRGTMSQIHQFLAWGTGSY
jgi:hypothetical protein